MRHAYAIALAAVIALVLAAPAVAKAPPKGKYECVIGSSNILFGTLAIKSGNRYSHRGTKGTFRAKGGAVSYPDGITGFRISFKKGTLNGMKGRWFRATDGAYEIALRNPKDDFESIYCDRP